MKIFFPLLPWALIGLANFSNLHGQVENRLKATNQVTGCRLKDRLEVIGYRLEEEDQRLQTIGCNAQELESSSIDGGRYNFIDNQSSFLENGSDPIFYLPSSISYLGITPKLMMDPVAIEEAGKVLKKELGISEGKISPSKPSECADSFTHSVHAKDSTAFTILQNSDKKSNAFSVSPSSTDSVLKNKIEEAISKTISNSLTQLQDHYKKADEAWSECDRGWKEQSQLYHELQTTRQQLTLSEQKLEQASKATTSEELEKTRLGKIAKYAGIAGDALGQVPEPHAQVASVGISKLGGIAETINSTWAKVNLALAKREHQLNSEYHERAQERETEQRQQILPLEQRAQQLETLATTQAEQSTRALAEQLHPQTNWQESQWQAWGNLIAPTWKEQDKHYLINQARLNPNLVEEVTRRSWVQKIEIGKEQRAALQKKVNLVTLKRQYDSACQQQKRAQTQEKQQRSFLDQGQNSIENLKLEIEKRVEELEKLETRDKVQFEKKRKEFIEKLKELEKTQLRSQGLQKKWEESVQRASNQDEQCYTASIIYNNAIKEQKVILRVEKICQTDRELLQKIWLKSATSNYKEWSLPEISTSQTTKNALESFEETRKNEECEPPIQRLEEIEARGRNLRVREAMMNSSITGMGKNSVIGTIQNLFSKQPSLSKQTSYLYPSQSNLDQVKEWVQKKQEHPSAQDQERWGILEKLDQLQKEITAKIKAQQEEESFLDGEQYHGKDVIDEKEDDGKSSFSTATTQTASSQAMSMVSVSKSSILSFGGRSLFNRGVKIQPAPSLLPINEENKKPQEKLSQLQTQANDLKERYFTLLAEAEKERLSPQGQKNATPFSEETDQNYVWEKSDRQSIEVIQQKRREQKCKKIAEEKQERWQTNTERWRARAQADQALKVFRRAQEHTILLGEEARKAKTAVQLAEARRKKEEALTEEEKLQQSYFLAEGEWENIAQEYYKELLEKEVQHSGKEQNKEQAYERLKKRDQAVNRRWEKLQHSYQNPGVDKSAVEQESISEAMMALEGQLEQAYQESFITYKNQEALAHYKEVAFKRALENARSYPEEMAEIWEQIGEKKENLPASQQEINKQAAAVFKAETKRLEGIETIWEDILKEEKEVTEQRREQAAQEYYRGNPSDWNALDEQEQIRYNNEATKANEEYEQKREGKETRITLLEKELEEIEKQLEETKNKHYWLPNAVKKRNQQQLDLEEQKNRLENEKKRVQEELHQQEIALNLGKRARQKESYYGTLSQAQYYEEKAREESGKNPYLKQAAEYYRKANTHWHKAASDKTLEVQQKQSEQIAVSYERAAEACEKAAQEHTALLTTRNRGKETLIRLYSEEAKLYEQLAGQQEKEESGDEVSDIYDIQETLQQLEQKIEHYLAVRGIQIEELQENISLLKKRLEELDKEGFTLFPESKITWSSKKVEFLKKSQENLATDLHDLLPSCQKALEELLQELPESNEQAATVLIAIQTYKIKEQQLQQIIEKIIQLEAKMTPLEQRVALLPSEITAAQGRSELFLAQGQQHLIIQLNEALEEARRVYDQLLVEPQKGVDIFTQFQTCMSILQQLEEQDRYLQQIAPQLQKCDQNKLFLITRIATLKSEVKTAPHQDEVCSFLMQGQEKLLMRANELLSEIHQIGEQLLGKTEKASEQASEILTKGIQFQQQDKEFEENATFLKELVQKKNSLERREETIKKEIIASENREEKLLGKGRQQLLKETGQTLSAINQIINQVITGTNHSSEQEVIILNQLKQLETHDQTLQENVPILLSLDEKRNFLQNRLKNLTAETSTPKNNEQTTYLKEGQQSLANEITQVLEKFDPIDEQFSTNANEAFIGAKILLTQLEQLVEKDQQFQQNAPNLEKLDKKKNFFKDRLETLHIELKTSKNHQELSVSVEQKKLAKEMNQALVQIDQTAKQLLSDTTHNLEKIQIIFNQLNILEERDQWFQECLAQFRDLTEKESLLKVRGEALENEFISSQIRDEILLAQAQQNLLGDIKKIEQQTSQIAKQLFDEDKKISGTASQSIKELLPLLEQLQRRDEKLQENGLFLRDLEEKKKLLQERVEILKKDITSSQNKGETFLAQQHKTLSDNLQQVLEQIRKAGIQLMQGADHALEQAQTLFQEIDQLQQHDQQLQKNIIKIQELEQKKKILQEFHGTLSDEMITIQNKGDVLQAQKQQVLLDKITQLLSRIEEVTEQLKKGIIGTIPTVEQVNILLTEIEQFEHRDLTAQIEEAKQASREQRGGEHACLWDRIVAKLEQSQESWNKFTEMLCLGKRVEAISWKKAADASEAAAEGIREAIESYILAQNEVAQRLENEESEIMKKATEACISAQNKLAQHVEKEGWCAFYLSNASTWLLNWKEAQDKCNQMQGKERDFWKNLADQYKVATECAVETVTALDKAMKMQGEDSDFQKNLADQYKTASDHIMKTIEVQSLGKESEGWSWYWAGKSCQTQANYQVKESQALAIAKTTLAAGYREAAIISQRAADQYKLAAQTKAEGKIEEGNSWSCEGASLQKKADYHAKACEAEEAGKSNLLAGYREAAVTSQRAVDQYRKAAQTHAAKKQGEGRTLEWTASSLQMKADYLAKATESEEEGKKFYAIGYREAAATLERAEEQYQKSAQAYSEGKEKEGFTWYQVGTSLQAKADYQVKVCEAQEIGKENLAAAYRKSSEISQKAADQYKLAAQTHAAQKENEAYGLEWAAKSLQAKAGYHAKASEAQEAKKENIIIGYREAVTTLENPEEQYQKSVKAYSIGEIDEGNSWLLAGRSFHAKADYQVKACEAQEIGKENLATAYRKSSEISQKSVDQYNLAAQTHAAKKQNEAWGLEWAAKSLQAKADCHAKASEAQEAGKVELSVGYREAATTLENTEEPYQKLAKAYNAEKENEGSSWYWVVRSFYAKADYQVKACEAQEAEKVNLANGYKEAVITLEWMKDLYQKSAQAYNKEKKDEGNSWLWAAKSLQTKVDYQIKAIEAEEIEKTILAAGCREAAETSQKAADQWKLSAESKAAGKESEGVSWGNEGVSLQNKADYQAKAHQAEEGGKAILAVGYREAAATSQKAADQWKLSAERKAAGKESEGNSWGNEGASLQVKASYEAKLIEAEEGGKATLAVGYREAAATSQRAADQWKLSAQAHAEGKEGEANSLAWAAICLKTKVDYQAKECEAQEAGKAILAVGYRKASITSQRAADQWKQSALAKASGQESEYTQLWQAAQITQAEADAIVKKAEA